MITSTARYPTSHASKYLQQLCKHFSHKVEVDYDETKGRVALLAGPAEFTADAEALTVQIVAETAKAVIESRFVIDVHLVTFAHREGFTGLNWTVDAA